ncbi:MAG TPA: N(4)-(beta-N-acetylglucosaminyl)-L-asparaginase [Armatimonadota bacterium]|jgi:isoaspartyl peptidase/L-asparaginase-like protein (Ntn-hydrolase superfamily)
MDGEGQSPPIAIATWNFGVTAVKAAIPLLLAGRSALDALEVGIRAVEDDPEVDTVGYGGKPNREGVVECDAGLLWGPTRRVGAVAGLRDIREAITTARWVMERTTHALLVGDGAREFAVAQGLEPISMLTDRSLEAWRKWKAEQGPSEGHDTVGMVTIDRKGDVCAGTSTSGLPWKLPGRVGDSPLVGSGFYADNAIGGAAATGQGEEILRYCASYEAVRLMGQGRTPQQACEEVLGWVLRENPGFAGELIVSVLACDKQGRVGGASTGPGFSVAVARERSIEEWKDPWIPSAPQESAT